MLISPDPGFGATGDRAGLSGPGALQPSAEPISDRSRQAYLIAALAALTGYLATSFWVFFARTGIFRHPGHEFIGNRADPFIEMWALAWWPHALSHGLNPFVTRLLWPPTGYNLAWTPGVPGPSLVAWPATVRFGPVVSYNLFCLLCPAAAAFSAFLLCYYLCRRFWPSLVGGYVFGFSPYMLSHIIYHLFLLFIFPVPLVVLLIVMRLDAKLDRNLFVGGCAALLLFEFLCSAELFATTTVFALMLLIPAMLIFSQYHDRLWRIARELGFSYAIVTLLLTPYLYYVVAGGVLPPINKVSSYSNDLLNFVVPPAVVLFGQLFSGLNSRLNFEPAEAAAYLGPGAWIILALYTRAFWQTRSGKFLVSSFILIALMSLGPLLYVDSKPIVPAPWWPLSKLPLLNQALAGRFGMYLFLSAGVIIALYLAHGPQRGWARTMLGAACVLFLAPDPSVFAPSVVARLNVPPFFQNQQYKRYLARGDNILVLPYMQTEDGLMWQIRTGYYFRLATARLTVTPREFANWPILPYLETGLDIIDLPEQLKGFLGANQVKAVIVDPASRLPWAELLDRAGLSRINAGGLWFYKVPESVLVSYRTATPGKMAARQAAISFAAMINAANRYLDAGLPLERLNPRAAQLHKVIDLPDDPTPASEDSRWWRNLWLGAWGDSLIGVGIVGDYSEVRPLIEKYRPDSATVYFPYPARLNGKPEKWAGQLLMVFTPAGLKRAAAVSADPHCCR